MIIIDNIIVSDEIIQEYFCCHLEVCHGCCCVSGRGGATLTASEVEVYEKNYQEIAEFLSQKGAKAVEGQREYARSAGSSFATPLLESGACAYTFTEDGNVRCSLDRAREKDGSQLQKPISCLLYPVRVVERPPYEILRFNHWDVCCDARAYGREKNIRLYQFVKEGLIRRFGRFGEEFYRRLSDLAEERNKR